MADFFGFNPAQDFEHGLHDDPGDGLDEDADDYDALNDETFGADSMGGDWEQAHEELSEITEKSRVHRDSYNSATEEQVSEYLEDVGDGLEDLALEASLSQLVDDYDDNLIGKERRPKQLRPGIADRVIETGYSCSPPSEFNVWAVNKNDQVHQQAQKPRTNILPPQFPKKIQTLEELERGLRMQPTSVIGPKQPPSALRLEDLEKELTSAKQSFPPGFPARHQPPFNQHHQDVVLLRNTHNGLPPGYPPPPRGQAPGGMRGPTGNAAFGQVLVPTQMQQGLIHNHNHRHMGPEMMRFLPPHLLMGQQQYQHHRNNMNFRPPYLPMPNCNPMMDPRNFPPGCRPPFPWSPHQGPPGTRFLSSRGLWENGYNRDEYDGLMTNREIQWLLNIQLIQLNTAQPFVDDFYYTVYQSRKPKNRVESRNGRERRDSNRDNRPESQLGQQPRVYTPLQFENSLGKLQCGSVTAPRKIIDMDVVQEASDSGNAQTLMKDSRRAKQLLLQLEQLYLLLMQIEDLDNPLAEVTPDAVAEKPALVQKIVTSLLAEDRLQSAMCVRKGKNLILRLLPHLPPSPHLTDVWACVARHLIAIGRRDTETELLLAFLGPLGAWTERTSLAEVCAVVAGLRVTTPYPPSRNVLVYALGNKFGISLLTCLINRCEELFATASASQTVDWQQFLGDLAEAAALVAPDCAATPVGARIPADRLRHHLDRFSQLKSDALLRILAGTET